MTITEIGRSIGLNRNSCAKYLDILHVNGQVEMKKDGNAKVFHLSHRVPIQALLNFSSDLIIILDHSLTIVEANDNLISMFKFKKEMMIDSKLANTGIPFFSEKGRLKLLRDAVRGKESKFETSVKLGDRPKHFKVRLIPSALGDGESGVTIIMENITNQKLAQKRIIESEERFRAIFNSSPDAIMMIKDNVFIYCNASTLKTFGANDYGEIYGLTPADLSPQFQLNGERTADSYRSYLKETMEIGYKDLEWIHRRKDGSEFHASVRLNRVEIGGEKLIQATVRDISDIISVQNELRSKESRLRNIASSLHGTFIGLLRRDLVFEEFWGTEELDKKYGIEDSSDLRGMSILEFTSKENHIEMKDRIEKCFRTGKPFMIEHQAELPNGRFWQEWSFSPYRNDLGNIEFLVKFGVDTQERNEMLRSLKKGEARFRNILSSLYNSFIGLINREYCFEEFWSSRELDNSYGITSSDMIGERITRFSPPEHEDDLIEIVDRVFQTGVPVTMEVPGKLPDGTYWQVITLSPYRNEKGEVEYVIMYGIDSTEKHDLFEKLKRTEEKYNILDSNSSDVIWMTDRDMNYTYLSSSIKDLTGYEPEELIGKNIIKRLSRSSYDSLFSRYERDINDFIHRKNRDYRMTTLEMDIKTKNGGETPCDVKINVIRDRYGVPTGLMGITRDISDRKRSWKELSKRENILEAVEQISDKLLRSKPDEGVISDSLEELGKAVGICRVYIFKNSSYENGRNLTSQIFEWTSDSISSQMDNSDLQDLDLEKGGLSRWIRELSSGNVVMGTVRDMSRSEREILEPQGIRSILLTPIFRGDHWWGFMGFDDCNTEREWSNTDIMALKAASNIFGCALNR